HNVIEKSKKFNVFHLGVIFVFLLFHLFYFRSAHCLSVCSWWSLCSSSSLSSILLAPFSGEALSTRLPKK
ncbi:hypothetical protein LEMLEM_LOCUS1027, partial [Lemmus lemmus]